MSVVVVQIVNIANIQAVSHLASLQSKLWSSTELRRLLETLFPATLHFKKQRNLVITVSSS